MCPYIRAPSELPNVSASGSLSLRKVSHDAHQTKVIINSLMPRPSERKVIGGIELGLTIYTHLEPRHVTYMYIDPNYLLCIHPYIMTILVPSIMTMIDILRCSPAQPTTTIQRC